MDVKKKSLPSPSLSMLGRKWFWTQTNILRSALHSFNSTFQSSVSSKSVNSTRQDVTSKNKMISEFSKAGDLVSALHLFDQMPVRDVVSWNSIMTACSHNSRCDEVPRIFSEMHSRGLIPNHTSFSIVLTSCAKLRALNQGRQIHGLSMKTCSSDNAFVGTCLIVMYSNCNVIDCLYRVFDDIECLNLASWNALISGFVLNRRISDAWEVFNRMPSRNVVSWTAMITGYIEARKLRTAFELFNLMPVKNSVSWSVMLGGFVSDGQYEMAIEFFARMLYEDVHATAISIGKVISACSSWKSIMHGRKMHGYVIKLGFQLDKVIEASLVLMYCECLKIEEARLEFDKMESKFIGSWNSMICGYINKREVSNARMLFDNMDERDKISWNSMINGYLKAKRITEAIELFLQMPEPTVETLSNLMTSFIEVGKVDEAQRLFNMIPQGDVMAYTILIFGYVKEGQLDKAMDLFNKTPERNVVTYNIMISGLLHQGMVKEAYKLFNESPEKNAVSWAALVSGFVHNGLYEESFLLYRKMVFSDISPSELVITSLLKASARLSLLIHGELFHTIAINLGHVSSLLVGNALINMYSKCGLLSAATLIFDQMAEKDVVTWNAMISGYACNGFGKAAINMFENMKRTTVKPDDLTFLGVLTACTYMCLLDEAQQYFTSMKSDYQIMPGLSHYACIIDLLCRVGLVEKAERIVSSMPYEPDSVIWTLLLTGCRINCNVNLAAHAAKQLFEWNPMDQMPYLHLISIYGSAGRLKDAENLKDQLSRLGHKKQPACSWI